MKRLFFGIVLSIALVTLGCSTTPAMKQVAIVAQSEVLSMSFSPDGSKLAVGSNDKTLKVYRSEDGHEWADLQGHEDGVWGVAFNSDATQLASVSSDKTVRLWDVEGRKELWRYTPGGYSVAFHPDDQLVAVGSDYKINLLNAKDGLPKGEIKDESGNVFSLNYSHDGDRLASGSQTVRYWDTANNSELWNYPADDGVRSLGMDNFQVLATTNKGSVGLQIRDGKVLSVSPTTGTEPAAAPDGKLSAEATPKGVVLRDMQENKVVALADVFPIRKMALSVRGKYLAVATDKEVYIFTR